MKILYLAHTFYPESQTGTEKFVYNMASSTQEHGHDVKVITYSYYQKSLYDQAYECVIAREFEYQNIPVIAFKYRNPGEMDDYSLEQPKLKDFVTYILDREKPDLIHVGHSMRTGEFVRSCIERGIPYILTLTDYYLICPKYIMLKNDFQICPSCDQGSACHQNCPEFNIDTVQRYQKAEMILQHASAITAPSLFVKNLFEREVRGINVRVVNHGLDHIDQREKLKVYQKGEQINFGYIGSFSTHKGIFSLIKVFNRLAVNLFMYGFSPDHMLLNLIFKKYDIHNIKLGGRYTSAELPGILENIDVLIIPSIWNETYCFVIYEAMMNQIPVIVADGGALTEKIKNGVEGFIYEKNNLEQLEQIISLIIANPEILNRFKANITQFKIPILVDEIQIYQELYQKCFDSQNDLSGLQEKTDIPGLRFSPTFIEEDAFYHLNEADEIAIPNEEWNDFLETHSENVERRLLGSLRYELDYLKGKTGILPKKCIIWGAGSSGRITRDFLTHFLPNFEIAGIIDSFQEGYCDRVKIYKPEELKDLKFDYLFIATTPGKKEAQRLLAELNLKLIDDYFFGYGVN